MNQVAETKKNITNASGWRRKGQEAEARRERQTVPLLLPSGAVIEACRPPLESWLMTGKLPFNLVRQFLSAHPAETAEQQSLGAAAENPEAVLKSLLAVQQIVCATVVRPRIVEDPQGGEDEIAPSDVPDEDFFFIYRWALNGSASLPVATTEGEVSAATLATFRDDGCERGTAGAEPDRQQVRAASE